MAYKFQIGKFKTAGEIDVSEGDIEINSEAVDNEDLAGGITMDKMLSSEDADVAFSGDAGKFVSSKTAKFNLDAEAALRVAGDNTLQGNIDAEEASRIAGDAAVQAAVDAEVTRATGAEAGLQTAINTEESARIAGDNTLQGNIDAEETARIAGDAAVQAAVDVEKGRIDAILSASTADTDTFKEVVDLINSVDLENDQALAAAVLSINNDISALQADVDGNEADADAAFVAEAAARSALSSSFDTRMVGLQGEIDAEETLRASEIVRVEGLISTEEAARIAGDSALSTSLTNLSNSVASDFASQEADFDADIAALQSEIDAEETRAQAAEAALQANIDSEETARIAGDTTLQGNIDALSGAVNNRMDQEVSDLEAADAAATTDRGAIRNEFALADSQAATFNLNARDAIQADVDANEAAALADRGLIRSEFAAADSALSSSIMTTFNSVVGELESDIQDLEAADVTLQGNIDAEETARIAADGAATTDRAAIRSEFAAADAGLQSAIDTEKDRIDAMLSGSSVDFDTLKEIVDAYQLADTDIVTSITNLQNDVDQNELDGDNDRAAIRSEFAAADSALSSSIMASFNAVVGELESDIQDLEAADVTLQGNIDAEAATRLAADNAATTDRGAIRSEFAAADAALSGALNNRMDQEVSALEAADAAATTDRGAIRSEFAAADAVLQGNIDAEAALRVSGDAALQTEINNLSGAVAADFASFAADLDAAELEHEQDYAALFASKSMNANGAADQTVMFVDASGGSVTVSVPAGTKAGEYKRFKRTDDVAVNSVTLSGTIGDGSNIVLNEHAALMLVWDGSSWWIM